MRTESERKIKADIRKRLEQRGAFWSNVPEGTYAKPGDPDMIVCYRGRFIGMEGKTPVGRLRDIQKVRMDQIGRAGGIYAVVRSVEDADAVLDEIDREMSVDVRKED